MIGCHERRQGLHIVIIDGTYKLLENFGLVHFSYPIQNVTIGEAIF
jgi:hypothetical protein